MNLSRLNHILIPEKKAGRDRWRRSVLGRAYEPWEDFVYSFTRRGRVVLFFWVLLGLLSLNVQSAQGYILWSGLAGLVVASMVFRRFFALREVTIEARSAPRVAMGEKMSIFLDIKNQGDAHHQGIVIRTPMLPWDGSYAGDRPWVKDLPPRGSARVEVAARFLSRGEHHLDVFRAAALTPMGLTVSKSVASSGIKFLVVPPIAPVTRLRLPTTTRYQPGGVALASQTGESMDLLGLRPYRPGDPVRDIHAPSWARLGAPVVKEYQQEYFTRIGVIVDTDIRGASEEQLEAALSLAAGVVACLSRGEALIDLIVVGGQAHELTLGRSLGFLDQALDLLAAVEPGPPFDPESLHRTLAEHMRRLSSVVLIALRWDERRQAFALELRRAALACRAVVVTDTPDTGGDAGDVVYISPSAVSGAEEIEL